MKKLILSLVLACSALAAQAMSYERAREEARFLTDKMAYELNLNDEQYNDCYEINFDYLLSLETADDVTYGSYLAYRNADLRHILLDWQWTIFAAADYFLNPVSWIRGAWYFPIYRHYRVGYYYYSHPRVFWSYRGGHGRHHYSAGFYASRRPHHWNGGFRGDHRGAIGHHPGSSHRGFSDRHHRGAVPQGHQGSSHHGRNGYSIGTPSNGRGNHSSHQGSHQGYSTGNHSSRQGYSIGTPSNGNNRGSYGNRGSSYNHESSTRTTVHNGGSMNHSGSISHSNGHSGSGRGASSFRSSRSSHVGGAAHSSGGSRGGSGRGSSHSRGSRGGR